MLLQSLSSIILQKYEDLIKNHVIVTLFLTMLVGAGGNAGAQVSLVEFRRPSCAIDPLHPCHGYHATASDTSSHWAGRWRFICLVVLSSGCSQCHSWSGCPYDPTKRCWGVKTIADGTCCGRVSDSYTMPISFLLRSLLHANRKRA